MVISHPCLSTFPAANATGLKSVQCCTINASENRTMLNTQRPKLTFPAWALRVSLWSLAAGLAGGLEAEQQAKNQPPKQLSTEFSAQRQLAARNHWAFKAPVLPEIPKVKDTKWVRNPIDAFVLARLEKERI